MTTKRELEKRVRAGVKLLDENAPGWERKINLRKLDLGHYCNCVVGQTTGTEYGPYALSTIGSDTDEAFEQGFNVRWYEFDSLAEGFKKLTAIWRDAVKRARARKKRGGKKA